MALAVVFLLVAGVLRSWRLTLAAVVTTSFIFCAGGGVIALASVRSVAPVGLLTTVGVASALITDLLLLPAIVSFLFARSPGKSHTAARAPEGSRQSAEETESTFSPRSAI